MVLNLYLQIVTFLIHRPNKADLFFGFEKHHQVEMMLEMMK